MWDMTVYGKCGVPKLGGERPQGSSHDAPSSAAEATTPPKAVEQDIWSAYTERDTAPSLQEMMAEARTRAEEQRKRFQVKNSTRYGDAPLEAYARLAKARSQGEASAVAGYARRRIAQFKTQLRQDGDNTCRIKAAIAQLQKAVMRAGRKKQDLGREEATQRCREKAEEEQRQRESLRLREELQRRQAMRVIRERGYLSEAAISNRMATQADAVRIQLTLPGGGSVMPLDGAVQVAPSIAAEQYVAMAAPALEIVAPTFSAEG